MTASHTNHRRSHNCASCGRTAPRDAIRIRGGHRFCAAGRCRLVAERIIEVARKKLATADAKESR